MKKNYVLDANILIEDSKSIENLKNGQENNIYIPSTVIEELDELKDKKPHLKNRIFAVIDELNKHKDYIRILKVDKHLDRKSKDNKILEEIINNSGSIPGDPTFVTNDKLLRFKAYKLGIYTEEYERQVPFKHESEEYTGIVDPWTEEKVNNCFYWDKGKLYFYSGGESNPLSYQNNPWKVEPLNHYQNCFLDLAMNPDINLVTVQSEAGLGKTLLSLAVAFYMVFEKKLYDKVYVVKTNYEIGNDMGYLPGDVDEKMFPYFKPVQNIISKLTANRKLPQKAFDEKNIFGLNQRFIEFIPINYLRGMNLDNCIVICEEIQNLSRSDARSLLSRMGDNVKCICTGDICQIDNPYLTKDNNAMNWLVKLMKGDRKYGHIVLKGKNARGPICQMVVDRGL